MEWQVWWGIAVIWHALLAFMLFDWSGSFPAWGLIAFYMLTLANVVIGLVLPVATGLGVQILALDDSELEPLWKEWEI